MKRDNNYTAIHIIGAVLVIIGHMYILLGYPSPQVLSGGDEMHGLGVQMLFLVSGFLGSQSYQRRLKSKGRIWNYLIRRIVRLYPPLIVCLLLTVFTLRMVSEAPQYYWEGARRYFLNNIEMRPKFDLPGVFVQNTYPSAVNGSLWTLPIEIVCYLMLIPIMELYGVIKNKKIFGIGYGVFFVFFSIFTVHRDIIFQGKMFVVWDTDWIRALNLIMWFLLGVLFGTTEIRRLLNWQMAMILVIPYACMSGHVKILAGVYLVAYVVFCFGEAEKPLFAHVFPADICYGMYLYAFPVQQLLVYLIKVRQGMEIPVYVYILLTLVITVGLAILNYQFVERLFSILLKKWIIDVWNE